MSKQRRRPKQQTGMLKALLLTGSVVATLAGTQLLPLQDRANNLETPLSTNDSTVVVVPADQASTILLPPGNRKTQFELKPIPQAVQPQLKPVARARSSR